MFFIFSYDDKWMAFGLTGWMLCRTDRLCVVIKSICPGADHLPPLESPLLPW